MVELAASEWVAGKIGADGFAIIDPRRPMKYLSGHLPGAINIPTYKAFGADGKLLAPDALAEWLGAAGLADGVAPIFYDSPEGQNAAMLAWILEYLGCARVAVMEVFFERWKSDGREVTYRPVAPTAGRFTARVNPAIRATLDDVRANRSDRIVDFRSREEFIGERAMADDRPGHIPGAANVVWRDLNGADGRIFAQRDRLAALFSDAGVARGVRTIAYCRSGPRAALGYLALRAAGHDSRLFDGSFAEWSRADLPIESPAVDEKR